MVKEKGIQVLQVAEKGIQVLQVSVEERTQVPQLAVEESLQVLQVEAKDGTPGVAGGDEGEDLTVGCDSLRGLPP